MDWWKIEDSGRVKVENVHHSNPRFCIRIHLFSLFLWYLSNTRRKKLHLCAGRRMILPIKQRFIFMMNWLNRPKNISWRVVRIMASRRLAPSHTLLNMEPKPASDPLPSTSLVFSFFFLKDDSDSGLFSGEREKDVNLFVHRKNHLRFPPLQNLL